VALSDSDAERLLAEAPSGRVLRGDTDRAIDAAELLKAARERFGPDVGQEDLDAAIVRVGCKRHQVTNLDHLLRRAARRLAGRSNPPPRILYVIPGGFYRERGLDPQDIALPPGRE
jgi:hypothetical protein